MPVGVAADNEGMQRFEFADAFWFTVPLKVLVLTVSVFGFLSLFPSLAAGSAADGRQAIFGLTVVLFFIALATTFAVAINDSYVEIDDDTLHIRFEAFFGAAIPLSDIAAVRAIDPRPRWRYRFGLSTDFKERLACSHGGQMLEIELARPWRTRLFPRTVTVRRFWLAVDDRERLAAALASRLPGYEGLAAAA